MEYQFAAVLALIRASAIHRFRGPPTSAQSWLSARLSDYPPDKEAKATETVLKQAELLCADWAA